MDLLSNQFNQSNAFSKPDADNSSSISRYLGSNLGGNPDSIFGDQSFADILGTQLTAFQPINSKVDSILQRLENNQPLVGMTDQEAASMTFNAIKQILSGVADAMKMLNKQGMLGQSSLEDLNRLIDGAKQLFDSSQDPFILEQLSETWETLRKKKSPLFHSVHSYFYHIAVTFGSDQEESLSLATAEEAETGIYSYTEQTAIILLDIVESFEDSSEKDELLNILELARIKESGDEFSSESMVDFGNVASSEQANFFFE